MGIKVYDLNDKKSSLWDYVYSSLDRCHKDKAYLKKLFNISNTTINNWEKENRHISLDKQIVLASLFGVTIDEFIEREINEDYFYENTYQIAHYCDYKNAKHLTNQELQFFFDTLRRVEIEITCYPCGYIPLEPMNGISVDKKYIDEDEIKYYCETLNFNIKYSTKEQKDVKVNSIGFKQLKEIGEKLYEDWGENAPEYIEVKASEEYEKIALLSENIEFLKECFISNGNSQTMNKCLETWYQLKHKLNLDYDEKNIVGKLFLAYGATLIFDDGTLDAEGTVDLCRDIMLNDVQQILFKKTMERLKWKRKDRNE